MFTLKHFPSKPFDSDNRTATRGGVPRPKQGLNISASATTLCTKVNAYKHVLRHTCYVAQCQGNYNLYAKSLFKLDSRGCKLFMWQSRFSPRGAQSFFHLPGKHWGSPLPRLCQCENRHRTDEMWTRGDRYVNIVGCAEHCWSIDTVGNAQCIHLSPAGWCRQNSSAGHQGWAHHNLILELF